MGIQLVTGTEGSAVFSDEKPNPLFRYMLTRFWQDGGSWIMGAMLHNPSTASHEENDPTIRRMIGFAKREGAGGLIVVNVAAYRTPDPNELLKVDDPIGSENERFVRDIAEKAKVFLVAWGVMSKLIRMKTWKVRRALLEVRTDVVCLGVTSSGDPRHPLYVRADQPFIPWKGR